MTTDELRALPHLTASEIGNCLRVRTDDGWRLTDGVRYCTRLFCALAAELPEYTVTDGKEEIPPSPSKGNAAETDTEDKAAGGSIPAADAAAAEKEETATSGNALQTETETQTETFKGWTVKAWEAARDWCAGAWNAACDWCAKAWRKLANKI